MNTLRHPPSPPPLAIAVVVTLAVAAVSFGALWLVLNVGVWVAR